MSTTATPSNDRLWTTDGPVWHIDLRWAEVAREYGWRASTGRRCIAALLGRRCRRLFNPEHLDPCLCDEATRFGLTDHDRRWIDRDGHPVLTWEPYMDPERNAVPAFRAWAAERGITVELGDRSPWRPGDTVLLIIRPAAREHAAASSTSSPSAN